VAEVVVILAQIDVIAMTAREVWKVVKLPPRLVGPVECEGSQQAYDPHHVDVGTFLVVFPTTWDDGIGILKDPENCVQGSGDAADPIK
jgi:hypothetical protein